MSLFSKLRRLKKKWADDRAFNNLYDRYRAYPDDVFVATYPKSGTTWTQMIVYQLFYFDQPFDHINNVVPHLEETALRTYPKLERPRLAKTHLGYDWMLRGGGKYLYLIRHGLDVAVSYFHHYRAYNGFEGSFDQFFDMYLLGKVGYGSWFSHISKWLANEHELDVLFLRYEDMLNDPENGILNIADHLGVDLPADVSEIVHRTSHPYMKARQAKFDLKMSDHQVMIRKGEAGQWHDLISEKQKAAYRDLCHKHLTDKRLEPYFV